MSDGFTNTNEMAEFNQGLAIIYRLDDILKRIHQARIYNDLIIQFKMIIAFYIELSSNLNKKENDAQEKHYKTCKKYYREFLKSNKSKIPYEYEDFLDAWEIELRLLQQDHNLGMPRQRDARFALAGK